MTNITSRASYDANDISPAYDVCMTQLASRSDTVFEIEKDDINDEV